MAPFLQSERFGELLPRDDALFQEQLTQELVLKDQLAAAGARCGAWLHGFAAVVAALAPPLHRQPGMCCLRLREDHSLGSGVESPALSTARTSTKPAELATYRAAPDVELARPASV